MSSLLDLNNDVLRAILARTCPSDQLNLHLTSSRVNNVMNSREFRQERCELGAAQVSVYVPTPFQLYQEHMQEEDEEAKETDEYFQSDYGDLGYQDDIYGNERSKARIYVDGKLAGKTSLTLLPRNHPSVNFHEMCDSVSSDLQETGCTFFDRRGRIRLESVKSIVANDARPFLYINSFDLLEPEYRTTTTTGAKALRKLLMETAALKDKWSIAIYVPDARSQFSENDREMQRTQQMNERLRWMEEKDDDSVTESEKNWSDRRDDLTKLDMRQFFRAGFRQTKETVVNHNCFFLFAVPSFLQEPMQSHEEAMSIAIEEKPKPPHEMNRDEKKLLELMKTACSEKKPFDDAIHQCQLPIEKSLAYKSLQQSIAGTRAVLQRASDFANESLQDARQKQQNINLAMTATSPDDMRRALVLLDQAEQGDVDVLSDTIITDQLKRLRQEELPQRLEVSNGVVEKVQGLLDTELAAFDRKMDESERAMRDSIRETNAQQMEASQQKIRELESRVLSEVSELLKGSGDDASKTIINSDAIHACACNLQPGFIALLLDFIPTDTKKRQAINNLDVHNETPLRIAAAANGAFTGQSPDRRFQTCQRIMELGGDKNLVDANGVSALGKFRKADQNMLDFWRSFGGLTPTNQNHIAQIEAAPALEELLRPALGPTAADEAIVDVRSENESNNDDDGEEMLDEDNESDEEEEEESDNEEGNPVAAAAAAAN